MCTMGVWEKGSGEREPEPESVCEEVALGLRWRRCYRGMAKSGQGEKARRGLVDFQQYPHARV